MKKGIVLKLAMFVTAFAISTFAPSMTAAAASYDDEFVALINQKRAANGLQPVSLNSTLNNAAETRAEELTEKFSYQRPDGRREFTVLDDFNVTDEATGENAAWGQVTPEEVVNDWMNSEGHRANILNPDAHKMGVGYYSDNSSEWGRQWIQIFTE